MSCLESQVEDFRVNIAIPEQANDLMKNTTLSDEIWVAENIVEI